MEKIIPFLILLSLSISQSFSQILSEDFESGFFTFNNAIGNTSNFRIDSTFFVSGNQCAFDSCISNDTDTLYHSSVMDLSSSINPQLTFWHIAKLDSSDKATVLISVDSGMSYSPLPMGAYKNSATTNGYNSGLFFNETCYPLWELSNFPKQNWWKKETFDLSGYASFNKVKILFVLTADSSNNKKGWYLDDIRVENSLCPSPYSISSFGTTKDSTNLTWINGGNDSLWQIQYDTINFGLGSGNFTSFLSSDTAYLTQLDSGTLYDVYVRSICKSGDTSDWVGPYKLKTNCETVDLYSNFTNTPYYQYFNSGESFNDFCWQKASGIWEDTTLLNYTHSNWYMTDYRNISTNTFSAKINLGKSDTGEWLISPDIDLGNDPNLAHCVSFDMAYTQKNSTTSDTLNQTDTLFILINYNNGTKWHKIDYSNYYFTQINSPSGLGEKQGIEIRNITGKVNIGFYLQTYDSLETGDLFIDNFVVEHLYRHGTTPCHNGAFISENFIRKIEVYPNPTNSNVTVQSIESNKTIDLSIYSIQGRLMKKKIISNSSSQIYVGDLPKGIYIFSFYFKNGSTENHRIVVY